MFKTNKKLKSINSILAELCDNLIATNKILMDKYNKVYSESRKLELNLSECKELSKSICRENYILQDKIHFITKENHELKTKNILSPDCNTEIIISLTGKCQKLNSENQELKSKIEQLQTENLGKAVNNINDELLNLCTNLSKENMVLIHKQPIPKEEAKEPERFKRDQY